MNKLKHHPHKTRETSKLTKEIHRTIEIILKCIPIQSKILLKRRKKILFPVSIRGVFEKSTARIHTNKIVHLKHIKKKLSYSVLFKNKVNYENFREKKFFFQKNIKSSSQCLFFFFSFICLLNYNMISLIFLHISFSPFFHK